MKETPSTPGTNGSSRPQWLDELPLFEACVGYGAVGFHGQLGYEHQCVRVGGRDFARSISAHGPSELCFHLPRSDARFQCEVAFNDDVLRRATQADFLVQADDTVVAVGAGVRPGEVRRLAAHVGRASTLRLRVETAQRDGCHSVWLNPQLREAGDPDQSPWRDALARGELVGKPGHWKADLAVVTLVTPGYDGLLNQLLGSLAAHGRCDAPCYVFALEPDEACERVMAQHGAVPLRCRRLGPWNATLKSVLYSAASLIEAQHYLCLDADALVVADLGPLVAALDALPPDRILVARDAFLRPGTLGDQLSRHYRGEPAAWRQLLGTVGDEPSYPLVVNDGVFAGSRRALLGLDGLLRSLPHAIGWTDQLRDHGWRNQFVFNLALARLRCGAELDEVYNLQMHMNDVAWSQNGPDEFRVTWRGRPARILHFCGWGRDKDRSWRDLACQHPPSLALT